MRSCLFEIRPHNFSFVNNKFCKFCLPEKFRKFQPKAPKIEADRNVNRRYTKKADTKSLSLKKCRFIKVVSKMNKISLYRITGRPF